MASLGILRLAVDQKLRQDRYVTALQEARRIQMSILPKRALRRGELEIAGYTTPAELVGGDYFDFIPVSDRIFGVAIADASGHGLPAALQVRDVYTGLRMAVERDFKIVRTVERLNRIIHESRLTTRFVSLFYGEIEDDDNVMYVNAGHPHPLHFHGGSVTPLIQTGLVLGPTAERDVHARLPEARARRRAAALHGRHGRGPQRRGRGVRRRAADARPSSRCATGPATRSPGS